MTALNIALILAGGNGSRFGGDCPKQFLELNGQMLLFYSVRAFLNHPQISAVFVVCHPDRYEFLEAAAKEKNLPIRLATGGDTRKKSSYNGLCEIEKEYAGDSIVLIHDAARPFVTETIISDNIKAAQAYDCCATAIPCQDTIYDGTNYFVEHILKRETIFQAQTPQSFRLSHILRAHRTSPASSEATDDVSLFTGLHDSLWEHIRLVEGDKRNFKVTTAEDFALAQAYLSLFTA